MSVRVLLLAFVCLASLNVSSRADIHRWDNEEVIPGTEGITPGPGAQLDHRQLEYALLSQNLTATNFESSNLSNASLYLSTLTNANLSGANLSNASLYGSTLTNANMSGSNSKNANLWDALGLPSVTFFGLLGRIRGLLSAVLLVAWGAPRESEQQSLAVGEDGLTLVRLRRPAIHRGHSLRFAAPG